MATKIDPEFVGHIISAANTTKGAVDTLINEVHRLEAYCEELEKRLTPEQIAEASSAAAGKW